MIQNYVFGCQIDKEQNCIDKTCQFDGIQDHHDNKSLGMSVKG